MESKYIAKVPDSTGYIHYTAEENETWSILYKRQNKIIKNRACQEFHDGLAKLQFTSERIPQANEVNLVLEKETGWGVEAVPAIIAADKFFGLLANKRFPMATFIRKREELDYLQEPDIFHELYGHCPLLTNESYGKFMEIYGQTALKASPLERKILFRLFWFTIEFGLINTKEGKKIYGGGILSSMEESVYSLEDPVVKYQDFDILETMRTPFRIDIIQPLYFVIESFEQLYKVIEQDLLSFVRRSKEMGSYPALFATPKREQNPSC